MRRSSLVSLTTASVPIAILVCASAFPGTEMRRNLYSASADCERDDSPSQCEQTNSNGGGHGGSASYFGPVYAADRTSAAAHGDPGSGRVGLQTATETSYRGGFGHFGYRAAGGA
jgi:hypothetical protein